MNELIFIEPQLCGLYRVDKFAISPGEWIAEEKFDGHRLIFRRGIDSDSLVNARAWSRYGEPRELPEHLRTDLSCFPVGVYDGELLVPGGSSQNVKELGREEELEFVVFDLLELDGQTICHLPWTERREFLETMHRAGMPMNLSETVNLTSAQDVDLCVSKVWDRGGEGLILKKKSSIYRPGKRSKEWLKIKSIRTAVVTVVGYRTGLTGPQSTVVVKDDDGVMTTVKTLNRKELAKLEADPRKYIGRKLMIEYQERTPDGSYRHPRWDRWVEDGE